jgi:hypothetical protein
MSTVYCKHPGANSKETLIVVDLAVYIVKLEKDICSLCDTCMIGKFTTIVQSNSQNRMDLSEHIDHCIRDFFLGKVIDY